MVRNKLTAKSGWNIKVSATEEAGGGDYATITLKVTDTQNRTSTKSVDVFIDPVPSADNKITYGGVEYELDNQLDPNLFRTMNWDTEESLIQSYPLKNGKAPLVIDYANELNPETAKLTEIKLTSVNSAIDKIDKAFLYGCYGLTNLNLSGLSKITSIGDGFLYACIKLPSVDLSSMTLLSKIPSNFLDCCEELKEVKFPKLDFITSIGDYFLNGCVQLDSVDLSTLKKVETTGESFLASCLSLTSVDLSNSLSLNSIDEKFLDNCKNLTTIKLPEKTPIPELTSWGEYIGQTSTSDTVTIDCGSIGTTAMYKADSKWKALTPGGGKTVKWTPEQPIPEVLNKVKYNGVEYELVDNIDPNKFKSYEGTYNFFTQTYELKDGGEPLTINYGEEFNSKTAKLQEVQIKSIDPTVEVIDDNFLTYCTKLTKVDLSGFTNIKATSHNFIAYAESLTSLDLSPMISLTSIGIDFLDECRQLTDLTLPNLSNVKTIDEYFIREVPIKSKDIKWSQFSNLETIGSHFLEKCNNIDVVDLSYATKLTGIGAWFLWEDKNITTIKLPDKTPIPTLVSWGQDIGKDSAADKVTIDCGSKASRELYKADNKWSTPGSGGKAFKWLPEDEPTPENGNVIKYGGVDYILKDNIDPNLFISMSDSSKQEYVTQTYELKDGGTPLTIDYSKEFSSDTAKVEEVKIRSIDSTKTTIGDSFLCYCRKLSNVDISGLTNITSVGNTFLAFASALNTLDLSPMTSLTQIGDLFLKDSSNLTSLTLPNLENVTKIGGYFLYNTAVYSVDLSKISNVQEIGIQFLGKCNNLTTVDISAAISLTKIYDWFLDSCKMMETVALPKKSPIPTLVSWVCNIGSTSSKSTVTLNCGEELYKNLYKADNKWSTPGSSGKPFDWQP